MHMLCYDYTSLQHLHSTKNTVVTFIWCILENQKKNVTSLSLTVLSKLNDCWDLLWIFIFWGVAPADGSVTAKVSVRWSQVNVCKTCHMSLQPGIISVSLTPAVTLTLSSRVCVCVRVCVQREIHSSIWDEYLLFVLALQNHFIHPPFCLSVVEQQRPFWLLRKEKH